MLNDGTAYGNTATTTIAINDRAHRSTSTDERAGSDFATTYTENGTPAAIADTDVIITDADNTTLFEATITLTNPQTNDLLSINGPLPVGITASAFVAGVLTLTSASGSSLADFQAALQQVVFSNQSENPSTTPRSITVTVNDGTTDSLASTTTVTVTQANDAPALAPATLAAVNEDTADPPGETIANLFSGLFTDNDGSAVFTGIAVSANPAAGAQGDLGILHRRRRELVRGRFGRGGNRADPHGGVAPALPARGELQRHAVGPFGLRARRHVRRRLHRRRHAPDHRCLRQRRHHRDLGSLDHHRHLGHRAERPARARPRSRARRSPASTMSYTVSGPAVAVADIDATITDVDDTNI